MVAVKKITNSGLHGKREFCTEIAIIGNIHHVNLVKLKGVCLNGRVRLLVYEYMNRGSLNRILFGNGGPVLEWEERLTIVLVTARGLAYLHSGCEHKGEKLVRITLCCVHEEPSLRPNMVTVVGLLEGGIPLGKPRIESLNFLRFYGRRFTEASTIRDKDEQNTLLYHQVNAYPTSTASSSTISASYVSSQQVSGLR